MALQLPSCSSSFPNEYFNYQVFLSFRGKDTQFVFANNLYLALKNKGIDTFIDHTGLEGGDEITPRLIKAISESRIYIPIFSEKYATSSFCLDELVHIMHGSREKGRLVLPVFYGVDPSNVRHQKGSYREALAKHEKKFQNNEKNMERLCQWKIALKEAANLSGYHFKIGSDINEYEHTFIGNIVQVVSSKLINRVTLHVADYPVGLESRVQKVNSLLNEDCNDGVCMIGIHGTGGIGKSTLARAVYNFIADQFECLCFLEDVRKNSLKHLQKQLLFKTIGLEMKIGGVHEGIGIIKERLRHKKVLLILDDVDELKQLEFLAGGFDWFGPNSRVIITTRDKKLLTCHGIERIYEVEGLDCYESLELFKSKAFKTKKVDSIFNDDIVNRAISYASGLPLAIDVIASNLSGMHSAELKSMLDRYKRIPPDDIQNILKVSFDGLDEESKNVFLDISCFFKGRSLKEVEGRLHAHYGYCIEHHVEMLVDKSLTKIDENGVVWLHDLIEHMGKEIVRKESPDHPEERTRLWFHEDIVEVLKQNKGTNKTKMIHLDYPSEKAVIDWNGNGFKKMTNLKTLVIKNGNFSKGSRNFPSSLRVLEWEKYPSTPLSIMNKKFEDMTVLKFDNCEYLTKISNVSCLPNLEEFSFQYCKNLITIDESIGFLSKLKILDAFGCTKLTNFPPLKLPSLERLELSFCESLQSFPEILDKNEKLNEIDSMQTSIKEIPVSFQNLIGLSEVDIQIETCVKIRFLCSCNIPYVRHVSHPNVIMWFPNMKSLDLSFSDFRILPECLKELTSLHTLKLDECRSLEDISAIPPNLQILSAFNCKSLNSSSKSMLLNKKLHEHGEIKLFCFPSAEGEMIPEWFNHQCRGGTFSFWFRGKWPSIMILYSIRPNVRPNNEFKLIDYFSWELSFNLCKLAFGEDVECLDTYMFVEMLSRNHTYILNLFMEKGIGSHLYFAPEFEEEKYDEPWRELMPKLDEAFEKNEWIHAEIKCEFIDTFHLYFKEENNVNHIRFSNPNSISQSQSLLKKQRLLDAEDLFFFANFTSENNDDDDDDYMDTEENNEDQPLLKKQRLLDVGDLNTELVNEELQQYPQLFHFTSLSQCSQPLDDYQDTSLSQCSQQLDLELHL